MQIRRPITQILRSGSVAELHGNQQLNEVALRKKWFYLEDGRSEFLRKVFTFIL